MKNLNVLLSLSTLLLMTSACAPDSARLGAPPQDVVQKTKQTPGLREEPFDSSLDVLFVIDHSMSMLVRQQDLANIIDGMAEDFKKTEALDVHIGVTTDYDSVAANDVRYQDVLPDGRHVPKQLPPGALRRVPVVNEKGEVVANDSAPASYFITNKTPNFVQTLKKMLVVGQAKLNEGGTKQEELFSPVKAAFTDRLNDESNKGFYRPNAHLYIIFITDADDQTPDIKSAMLHDFLVDLKKDPTKVSYAGILARVGSDASGRLCETPAAQEEYLAPPQKIKDLINLQANYNQDDSRVLNMCGKYGKQLSDIGIEIRRKVLARQIVLEDYPEVANPEEAPFIVSYGLPGQQPKQRQVIPRSLSKVIDPKTGKPALDGDGQVLRVPYDQGWSFDYRTRTLTIHEDVKLTPVPGATIQVDYRAVLPDAIKNGLTNPTRYGGASTPLSEALNSKK